MAQPDRSDVLTAAASGDEIAFQQIIAEHHDDMRRVCSYVTRDDAVAEEATIAAWGIAWRKIGSVREPTSLRPWLISVAVNEAKRMLRKSKRRAEVEATVGMPHQAGSIDPPPTSTSSTCATRCGGWTPMTERSSRCDTALASMPTSWRQPPGSHRLRYAND